MKKWLILGALLIVMALVLSSASPLTAQTPTRTPTPTPTPPPTRIEGQVTAVDIRANKITITPSQGKAVILTITADTEIEVWGKKPATLQDVKVGNRAEVKYNTTTMAAIELEAKAEAPRGTRQGFFGVVTRIAPNSLVLDTKQGAVTLTMDANTQFWNPPKKDATVNDVKVGDRIAVLAEKPDSALLAKRVLVIPAKPTFEQISGVVTRISGNDITITYNTNKTVVAQAPPGIAKKIELGYVVTAVIIRTPGVDKVLLKDIESGDKLLERLLRLAASKTGKDKEDIERMIVRDWDKQHEKLQSVLDKVPDDAAKRGIRRALEQTTDKASLHADLKRKYPKLQQVPTQ